MTDKPSDNNQDEQLAPTTTEHGDTDSDWRDHLPSPSTKLQLGVLGSAIALLMLVLVVLYAPTTVLIALIGLAVGFLPGVLLFPWLASPFGPGLSILSEPFVRIHLTISQVIRRAGVLVKRQSGEYEFGTYLDDGTVVLSDARLEIDDEKTNWGLFGKRPLGLTWEEGTPFHRRIKTHVDDAEVGVNMAAAHRYLRGSNHGNAIFRTEEKAEAEHGGGGDGITGVTMALLVGLMLVLGTLTAGLMI